LEQLWARVPPAIEIDIREGGERMTTDAVANGDGKIIWRGAAGDDIGE
jgi:hypothetical protein